MSATAMFVAETPTQTYDRHVDAVLAELRGRLGDSFRSLPVVQQVSIATSVLAAAAVGF
jgi:hypothetical protein